MGEIKLEGLEFFARHGVYKSEQESGNRFSVDVTLKAELLTAAKSDNLQDTFDYGKVYSLVSDQMLRPSKLLENVAFRIIKSIKHEMADIKSVEVTVSKYNPPLGGICLKSSVTLNSDYLDLPD